MFMNTSVNKYSLCNIWHSCTTILKQSLLWILMKVVISRSGMIKPTDSALLLEAHVHPSPPPGVCRTQLQDGDVTNVSFLAEGGVLLFVDWRVCFCTFVAGLLVVLLVVDRIGRKKSMALCFFMFSLFILPLYACIDRWVWLLRRHFVTFKQQSATCLSLRPHRIALTVIIFIARAFISSGFEVVFLYTPEVCQYFNHLKIVISLFWID